MASASSPQPTDGQELLAVKDDGGKVDTVEEAEKTNLAENEQHFQDEDVEDLQLSSEPPHTETHETLKLINDGVSKIVELLEHKGKSSSSSGSSYSGRSDSVESDDEGDDDDEDDEGLERLSAGHLLLKARECDYAAFKESVQGQKHCVVDFLLAGNELPSEARAWRERHFSSSAVDAEKKTEIETSTHAQPKATSKTERKMISKDPIEDRWIRRVRINSIAVITLLLGLASGEELVTTRVKDKGQRRVLTFFRPFSLLIHYQASMRHEIENLKGERETNKSAEHLEDGTTHSQHEDWSLAELQSYLDFVEDRLMPASQKWSTSIEPTAERPPGVKFEDLWYLFQPGDLVYVPPDDAYLTIFKDLPAYQFITRIVSVQQPTCKWHIRTPGSMPPPTAMSGRPPHGPMPLSPEDFSVAIYHLEFDGKSWGAASRRQAIQPFGGERDVMTLPVYPLRFVPGYKTMLEQGVADGKSVVNLVQNRYGFYNGWSLITTPLGHGIQGAEGEDIRSPTHIGSDVLVDYTETFNTIPRWRPILLNTSLGRQVLSQIQFRKDVPNLEWSDSKKQGTSPCHLAERIVDWNELDLIRAHKYEAHDEFLSGNMTSMPTEDDFALIPRRFWGYSVRERKFFHLDIRSVQQRGTGEAGLAFKQLQVGPDHKQLINSLVQSHFNEQDFQERHDIELDGQDLIRGKGKGLVILLHGVPGVGKTATAEAVAQKWQRPLFPITCGDLGVTSESVETILNDIFRLAHLWNCILLLDEADVFITERKEVGDLQRNGLVSVFLRMLEYYNGILFLTTNKPGVLDEAVKSRVHLSLPYSHLDWPQTRKLFEFNLQRLKQIEEKKASVDPTYRKLRPKNKEILNFARKHYDKAVAAKGVGRWNGRQIRNAFLIASSLAHYGEGEDEGDDEGGEDVEDDGDPLEKQLGANHFEKVDRTTTLYDQYRQKLHNKDEDLLAQEKEHR